MIKFNGIFSIFYDQILKTKIVKNLMKNKYDFKGKSLNLLLIQGAFFIILSTKSKGV